MPSGVLPSASMARSLAFDRASSKALAATVDLLALGSHPYPQRVTTPALEPDGQCRPSPRRRGVANPSGRGCRLAAFEPTQQDTTHE